jgi:hypothetical protein
MSPTSRVHYGCMDLSDLTPRVGALALCLLAPLSACAPTTPSEDLADKVMRSLETGNTQLASSFFNPNVRSTMTPASVHELARVMHAFGHYHYVTETAVLDNRRYDLEAQFDVGSMLVQMRLDSDGKIAGLHIIPNSPRKTARTGGK